MLPMPPLERIIPSMHTYWNKTKGGSDVTIKLMDTNLAPLPFTNPETVAVNRLISIIFVLIYRVDHIFSSKKDLPYPSLAHYRNAATHRSTLTKTFIRSFNVFKSQHRDISAPPSSSSATTQESTRVQPSRRKIYNVPLARLDDNTYDVAPSYNKISPTKPHTPKGLAKKIKNGLVASKMIELDRNCSGKIFYTSMEKQRCSMCKSKTSYFCLGCKQWFCFNKNQLPDMSKVKNFSNNTISVCGQEKIFQVCCFQKTHYMKQHNNK